MTTLLTDSARSVPFFDGAPMMDGLKEDMRVEISALIDSGRFINGPDVAEFEASFAAYCQTAACVGAARGLDALRAAPGGGRDALRLALSAGGLEQGDEVIVPAQTFIATFEAVTQAGGVPVVVGVSQADYNMASAAARPSRT